METTAGEPIGPVTDSEVTALAADRPEPMLPVLQKRRPLEPLIVVLAVLPGILALEHSGTDSGSAVWALRALSDFESEQVSKFLFPGRDGRTASLSAQPPLATWLTSLAFFAAGPFRVHAPLIVPLLATAGVVWCIFRVLCELHGVPVGFWAALLLSIHSGTLLMAANATPTALSVFLILVCAGAWLRHVRERKGMVSARLLIAGLALGLTLLAGGPVVLAVLSLFLLHPVINRLLSRSQSRPPVTGRSRFLMRSGTALLVTMMTAFALGGWWLMSAASYDDNFWSRWFAGYDAATWSMSGAASGTSELNSGGPNRVLRMVLTIGPLLSLSLYGVFRVVLNRPSTGQDMSRKGDHRASQGFLLSWLMVALGYALLTPTGGQTFEARCTLADAFLLIPAVGLAAVGVEGILQREASLSEVLLLTATMIVPLPFLQYREPGRVAVATSAFWISGILAVGVVTAAWIILRWTGRREARRRLAIGLLLTLQVAAVALNGLLNLAPPTDDEQRLTALRRDIQSQLPKEQPTETESPDRIAGIVLMSDAPSPPQLEYAMRSIRPSAGWIEADHDNRALGEVIARYQLRDPILVIEWVSTRSRTALSDIPGRDVVAVGEPKYYRGRELRAFLLNPTGRRKTKR